MKNVKILLKNYLRCRLGIVQSVKSAKSGISEKDGKGVMKGIGRAIVMLAACVYLIGIYGWMMYMLFDIANAYGQPEAVLTVAVVAASLIVLLFGGFTAISELYYSKDREILLSMPIKPIEMIAFKFSAVYLWELMLSSIIMLPAAVIYGVMTVQGVPFYIASILVMLLIPIIPLAIAAFVIIVIMRFTTARRQSNKLSTIAGLVFFVVIMIGNYYITGRFAAGGNEFVYNMLISENGLIGIISARWLPGMWATKIMTAEFTEAAINFIMLFATTAAAVLLLMFIAKKMYIKGMLNSGSTGVGKSKDKRGGRKEAYVAASPVKAIFFREWKEILRTPAYAMNSLISVIMGPILVCMPMIMNAGTGEKNEISHMVTEQLNKGNAAIVIVVLCAIFAFLGTMNMAGATMISREGTMFYVTKTYPQRYGTMIMGKFWCAYSISALGSFTTGIAAIIAYGISPLYVAAAIAMSLVVFIPFTAIGILSDLRKPKLRWDNPTVAIKQNINGMIGMGLCMIAATIIGGAAVLCLIYTELPIYVTCIVVPTLCSLVIGLPLVKIMKPIAERKLSGIE